MPAAAQRTRSVNGLDIIASVAKPRGAAGWKTNKKRGGNVLNCLVKAERKDQSSPAIIITRAREVLLGHLQYQIRIQSKNL